MSSETENVIVSHERTTLSALLARHYGKVYPGIVGATYALNQNLAREGVFLPVGREITVYLKAHLEATAGPGRGEGKEVLF